MKKYFIRVVGQEEAVEAVARAIRRSKLDTRCKTTYWFFLVYGTNRFGKTELSKAIAEAMFDNENNLFVWIWVVYGSSFCCKTNWSTSGYVGYDEGGQLTEQVRRKPYSVVLFDEIEKPTQISLMHFFKFLMMGD